MTKAERESLWATSIAEFRESGQSVPVRCAEHDINPRQLYYWLRKEEVDEVFLAISRSK